MKINRKQFFRRAIVYGVTLTILHGGIFWYYVAIDRSMGRFLWLFIQPETLIYQFLLNRGLNYDPGSLLSAWVLSFAYLLNSAFWGFIIGFPLAYVATRFIQRKPIHDSNA